MPSTADRGPRRLLVVFAAAVVTSAVAPATALRPMPSETGFGVGLALGAPTAFDFKWWASPMFGLNAGVGSHYFAAHLAVYVDGELNLAHFETGRAHGHIYLGPHLILGYSGHGHYYGFKHRHHGRTYFALGAAFGYETDFWFPLNVFAELRPAIAVAGHLGAFDLSGHVGARFRF